MATTARSILLQFHKWEPRCRDRLASTACQATSALLVSRSFALRTTIRTGKARTHASHALLATSARKTLLHSLLCHRSLFTISRRFVVRTTTVQVESGTRQPAHSALILLVMLQQPPQNASTAQLDTSAALLRQQILISMSQS